MYMHNFFDGGAKKSPFSLREEVAIQQTLLIFARWTGKKRLACVRAGIGTWRGRLCCRRLPWFHRASPSATLNEIRYINEYG
jgi:hypothetical protein